MPERVAVDVFDDDQLAAIHGRATGADIGADGETMHCLVEAVWQARRSAVDQVFLLFIDQQHRTQGTGRLRFGQQADGFENLRERLVGGNHAEDVALILGVGFVVYQAGDVVGDGKQGAVALRPACGPEQVHCAAILAPVAVAKAVVEFARHDGCNRVPGAFAVFVCDELQVGLANQLFWRIAKYCAGGRAELGEAALLVDGAEYVHGVVHDPLVEGL
ncbi:hypothetical protein D3C84_200860 [compost metagenome]